MIKAKNLWKHIGSVVIVKKEIGDFGDLVTGSYQIVEVDDYNILFYNILTYEFTHYSPLVTDEFTDSRLPINECLEILEESLGKYILQLINEGWTMEGNVMNLTSRSLKLEAIKSIRKIV